MKKFTTFTVTVLVLSVFIFLAKFTATRIKRIKLDSIFKGNPINKVLIPEKSIVTIVATGDVSFAHGINNTSLYDRKNFIWVFEKVSSVLQSADILLINLESPIFSSCIWSETRFYLLCGSVRFIEGLKYAGVDVVNVSNNHIIDYGVLKAREEIKALRDSQLLVSGIDSNAIKIVKGVKIGFLGFNDIKYNNIPQAREKGSYEIIYQADDTKKITRLINDMKKKTDLVVVSFHWGTEYTHQVTERQKFLGHLAIDSGADLVVGNHPHWIQPIELYKDKIISYSHGSLVFDLNSFKKASAENLKNRFGLIGKYSFFKNKLVRVELILTEINNNNQPRITDKIIGGRILETLRNKSGQLIMPNFGRMKL